jgi:NAD(P)-dependent dehydrogenase (short-subunit alcohol dehydrogenase family)
VDILVNNAGIQHVASTEDFPVERWDAILAINLSSAFHATRLALPAMQAAGWGRSSTWPQCTGWWRRLKSPPMWPPSMAWWA